MYNCYNEGIQFLKDKCGKTTINTGMPTRKNPNAHKVVEVYKKENIGKKPHTEEVERLLRQYNYGIAAKKELFYLLMGLGYIKEEKSLN